MHSSKSASNDRADRHYDWDKPSPASPWLQQYNAGAQQYPRLMAAMMAKSADLPGLHGNSEPWKHVRPPPNTPPPTPSLRTDDDAPTLGAEEAAAAAPPSCRDGMEAVGATPDGAWTVCERTLSPDPLTGKLVPAGQLECAPAHRCAAGCRLL